MFTKAVRSETITRPVFSNLKKCDFDNNYIESIETVSPNINTNKKHSNVIACHEDERPRFSGEVGNGNYINKVNIQNCEYISSDSLILFSPLLHRRSSTCNFNISTKDEPTLTSFTTAFNRSDENYSYSLYEELMNDIPTYIKNNFSSLIRENIINKTRKCLQVLCAKSSYRDLKSLCTINNNGSDDDILPTSKEIIVQNPMDYIKLGWLNSGQPTHKESTSNGSCSTPDTLYSPFVESQNIPSLLSCTPDYDYFPHKLNG